MFSRSIIRTTPTKLWFLGLCLLATIYGLLTGSRLRNYTGWDLLSGIGGSGKSSVPEDFDLNDPPPYFCSGGDGNECYTRISEPSDTELDTKGIEVLEIDIPNPSAPPTTARIFSSSRNGEDDSTGAGGDSISKPVDENCGEICDITMSGQPTRFHPFIRKKVNCRAMMRKLLEDPPRNSTGGNGSGDNYLLKKRKYGWPPPREPPQELHDRFTMWGQMPIPRTYYFAQGYAGQTRAEPITVAEIESKIKSRARRIGMGSYGLLSEDVLQAALTKYGPKYVANKTGLDFGSSHNTWLTAMALINGASRVYMLDYGATVSQHPKIVTLLPKDLYGLRNDTTIEGGVGISNPSPIEFVLSFSSIEHSGLGRYGDELHPEGDLIAMAQIWCMIPRGAIFLLNVPFDPRGSTLHWNAHRIYGPNRLQHLTANWEVIDFIDACTIMRSDDDCHQRVQTSTALWVLKKV